MHFHLPSLFKPQLFILYIQFLANAREEQQSPQLGYECETGEKSRNLTDHWKFHAVRTDLQETIQKLAILTNSYYWISPGRPMEGCPYSMHALFPKIVEPPTCAERKTREYTQHFKTLTYFHGNREGLCIFFWLSPGLCHGVLTWPPYEKSPMRNHPSRLGHPQRLQHLNLPRGDCKHFPQLSSNSAVGSPRLSAVDPNEEPLSCCAAM